MGLNSRLANPPRITSISTTTPACLPPRPATGNTSARWVKLGWKDQWQGKLGFESISLPAGNERYQTTDIRQKHLRLPITGREKEEDEERAKRKGEANGLLSRE